MNNKGTGAVFCLIAAILLSAKYISAATFLSHTSSRDAELFSSAMGYIGPTLTVASIVALVVGVFFLVLGFVRDK